MSVYEIFLLMLNLVIALENGNLNPVVDSFGLGTQNLFLTKDTPQAIVSLIFKELLRLQNAKNTEIMLTATKCSEARFFSINDIIYIESFGNLKSIISENDTFEFYGALHKIELLTSCFGFLRVHHSYIISPKYIKNAGMREVTMTNGKTINVGRKYIHQYRQAIQSSRMIRLN